MGLPLGPIQTLPRGLTGLLNLKVLGRVPDELLGTVQPTVDIEPYWMNYRAVTNESLVHGRTLTTQGGGALTFSPGNITVPDGEIWYVHHYGVDTVLTAAAGQVVERVQPCIIYNLVGTIVHVPVGTTETLSSSATVSVSATVGAHDFWLPPGASLGFYVGSVTSAAGAAFTGRYQVTKMPI